MNEAINPNRTRKKWCCLLVVTTERNVSSSARKLNRQGEHKKSKARPIPERIYLGALEGKVCNIGDDIQ